MGNFVLKRDLEQHDKPIQAQSSSVKFKYPDISYMNMKQSCAKRQIEQIHKRREATKKHCMLVCNNTAHTCKYS